MIQVGLTGNAASGKSEVARVWARAGIPVVSADELSRRAVEPGSPALDELVAAFGGEVLDGEGRLDRARMRERIFRDPEARRRLEAILHPRIAELRDRWVDARRREGAPVVVSEVPLLFEVGLEEAFDAIVVVDAPAAARERRLVEGRGLDPEEARRIMVSQGDPGEKRRRADHVIRNDGSLADLQAAALEVLGRIREAGGRGL